MILFGGEKTSEHPVKEYIDKVILKTRETPDAAEEHPWRNTLIKLHNILSIPFLDSNGLELD